MSEADFVAKHSVNVDDFNWRGSYRSIFMIRDQIIAFTEKRDFKKFSSWSVTQMFRVTREELQSKI